jgi:YD repeat-containing protein
MEWKEQRPGRSVFMRRLAMIPILVLVPACGSSPPPSSGGAPPVGATPISSSTPRTCRTYATALTASAVTQGPGWQHTSTESDTCLFDAAEHVLRCTGTVGGSACTNTTRSWTYAELADFFEETKAVGRERYDTMESESFGNCAASTTREVHTYDAEGRPIQLESDDSGTHSVTTFTEWDALGRPTQATWTSTGGCRSGTETATYDDDSRIVVKRGSYCSANPSVLTLTYDADGTLVGESWTDGRLAGVTFSRTRTVTATATVCLR